MTVAINDFRTRLEEAVAGRHSQQHPFSKLWMEGQLTKEQFGEWVRQHYHYVGHFSEWLGTMFGDCKDQDVRDFLLQNMWEEELAATRHTELLLRFGEACGMPRDEVIYAEERGTLLPSTEAFASWCRMVANKYETWEAAAALIVGLESQTPAIYQRQVPVLEEKYHFDDYELEFFYIHITSDVVHGERGYQIVERYADTPEKQERALQLVNRAAKHRWLYMSGLYRKAVLGEEM
ncbi:MAG: aldehyde dehydrogenase [Sulfobacillus thermosulfidooxidans]|uniref:Aldehyde dehydrogenase n=1 Tax=Sulfobacillus thermosulfidooxidans TaxID=28034 RepID=A0A2T2WQI4_SULTH|nr:MAG: aldehyde dehydrogenase [Sulfobacillus thermosulfidooxidans]